MKTCETCRFWNRESEPHSGDFRVCDGIAHKEEAFGWDENYENYELKDEHASDMALAIDGSGYFAGLITLKSFGCTMHKALNTETES